MRPRSGLSFTYGLVEYLQLQKAQSQAAPELFKYRLDANVIFEEAALDPRLKNGDAIALESKLQSAGCMLPIWRSFLYQAPHFVIPIE
jgi:hypothetical protein